MAIRFAEKPQEPVKPVAASKPSRKGAGGRPKKDDTKVAVTLRLTPNAYANLKTNGDEWRKAAEKHMEEWLELGYFPP